MMRVDQPRRPRFKQRRNPPGLLHGHTCKRMKAIDLPKHSNRVKRCGHARAHLFRDAKQDAMDLLPLLLATHFHVVAGLHDLVRLHVNRFAGTGAAVKNSRHAPARSALQGKHMAAVANGGKLILKNAALMQLTHEAVDRLQQVHLRSAQVLARGQQFARRIVPNAAVAIENRGQLRFKLIITRQLIQQTRKSGNILPVAIAKCTKAICDLHEGGKRLQVLLIERRARDAHLPQEPPHVREPAQRQRLVPRKQSHQVAQQRKARFDGLRIGKRRKTMHEFRAKRGTRTPCDQLQHQIKL